MSAAAFLAQQGGAGHELSRDAPCWRSCCRRSASASMPRRTARARLEARASRTTPTWRSWSGAGAQASAVAAWRWSARAACRRDRSWRSARAARVRDERADVGGDAGAEDGGLEQRVRGEPVGAVQAGRGHLARGPQALDGGAAAQVGGDAAHVIVRGRRDGDELVHGIDAGGAAVARRRSGKASGKRAPMAARQSRKAPRPAAISAKTPRATMSRGASSASGCRRVMKRSPARIDEDGAFAAQRFGGERRRDRRRRRWRSGGTARTRRRR